MKAIFPIEFEFGRQRYYGIVRVREKHGAMQMKVRIMNGRIDRLFYGHHVFNVIDNHIVDTDNNDSKAAALRHLVQDSLQQYIQDSWLNRA